MEVPDSGPEELHRFSTARNRQPQRVCPLCRGKLRSQLRRAERTPEGKAGSGGEYESAAGRTAKASGRNAGIRPQAGLRKLRLRSVNRSPKGKRSQQNRVPHFSRSLREVGLFLATNRYRFFPGYGFAYFNTVDKSIPRTMLSER